MINFTIELGLKSTIFPFCHMSPQYKPSFMGMPMLSEAKALGTKLGSLPGVANLVIFTVGTQNYYCFQNLEFINRITEYIFRHFSPFIWEYSPGKGRSAAVPRASGWVWGLCWWGATPGGCWQLSSDDTETSVPVNTLPTDTFAVNKCLLWQHHRRPNWVALVEIWVSSESLKVSTKV